MKKFRIWNSENKQGEIVLGNVLGAPPLVKVELLKLKIGDLLIEDSVASLVFSDKHGAILKFTCKFDKLLIISKYTDIIDYIWENSGKDRVGILYSFTSEFKNNYLE